MKRRPDKAMTIDEMMRRYPERFDFGDFTRSADHDSKYMDERVAESTARIKRVLKTP
jgi:hypothetical protein